MLMSRKSHPNSWSVRSTLLRETEITTDPIFDGKTNAIARVAVLGSPQRIVNGLPPLAATWAVVKPAKSGCEELGEMSPPSCPSRTPFWSSNVTVVAVGTSRSGRTESKCGAASSVLCWSLSADASIPARAKREIVPLATLFNCESTCRMRNPRSSALAAKSDAPMPIAATSTVARSKRLRKLHCENGTKCTGDFIGKKLS